MIDALIAGKLYGQPQQRTGKSGKPFVIAKVRVAAGDGDSLFVNVIAFSETVCTALLALGEGEAVALAGSVTPKVWIDKDGQPRPALDMVAAQVLTPYHVTRKRAAMSPAGPSKARVTDDVLNF
ncbi:MAG: single-stranded DNA-binding protein [Burkholderiaceae bacterium]|jgi:single-stranded DNA-binding protein|nr:single-stranded DNA-binding protein [Burkholderiaceae bacterium]